MTTPTLELPPYVATSGASTPLRPSSRSDERPEKVSRSDRVQLTDQTNLLPMSKIVPVFLGLAACVVVSALDSVIVATALPTIASAFSAGAVVSWVPSAYLLTSTAFQPLYGRFSDIFGRKSAMALAMTSFMVGNLIAGFSKSITQMIVSRGIAGAGGGGIISMMQIIISDVVTLRDRGKYQGVIGSVVALGYAVGPLIGGALVQNVGWEWCYWITIPISFCATIIVIFVLPLKPVQGDMKKKLLAVDYVGSFLTLLACTLLILPLIWGGVTFPWDSAVVLVPLFCGVFVAGIFCLWEWKGAKLPIVPMYIFRIVTVTGVYIAMFVNGFVFFSTLYYLPQFFQVALGYGPMGAGIFLIPVLVSQMAANWASGIVISKTGRYRRLIHSGFAVWAIGSGCISTIRPGTHKAVLVVFMLLSGLGGGQTMQTTTVAAQASVSRRDMSVVTAFRNFIRMLGGTLSLALSSTIINNALKASMRTLSLPESTIDAVVDDPTILHSPTNFTAISLTSDQASYVLNNGFTKGFRDLFVLNAALCAGACVSSIFMIKHKDLNRQDDEQLKKESKDKFSKSIEDVEAAPVPPVPPAGGVELRDLKAKDPHSKDATPEAPREAS